MKSIDASEPPYQPSKLPKSATFHGTGSNSSDPVRDTLKLLIEKKVGVNAKDRYQLTPLHHAVIRGNGKAVEVLLDHADINKEVM